MAGKKDITNQQLLEALSLKFDSRFNSLENRFRDLEGRFDILESRFDTLEDRFDKLEGRFDMLEGRFDKLEERVAAIDKTLADTVGIMATREDVNELKKYIGGSLDDSVDDLELRLGRRIDHLLKPSNKRKLIAAKA